jgi:maltose O-acetyltransferase
MLSKIITLIPYLQWKFIYKAYNKKYNISEDFIFNGPGINFYGSGSIVTGKKSHIGSYSTIQAASGCIVSIGINCRISHNVRIYTKSDIADQDFSKDIINKRIGDVMIGDHVWIGVNTYISPNVKIGENSVIGANSVVTKDIPNDCIAGGVPAKVIKYKANYKNKVIQD